MKFIIFLFLGLVHGLFFDNYHVLTKNPDKQAKDYFLSIEPLYSINKESSLKNMLLVNTTMTFNSTSFIWIGKSFNFKDKNYRNMFFDKKSHQIVYSSILSEIEGTLENDIMVLKSKETLFYKKTPVIDVVHYFNDKEISFSTDFLIITAKPILKSDNITKKQIIDYLSHFY